MAEVTVLLQAARDGDPDAVGRIFELLYGQLKRIARARLSFRDDRLLLDTASLVNETYLKLLGSRQILASDRNRFLAYAASAMRSVVIDTVRERQAARRGGGPAGFVTLDTKALRVPVNSDDAEREILAVHEALDELRRVDERMVAVVEMRYFAGLSNEEIAKTLGVTARTVNRDWDKARMFLFRVIKQ